MMKIVLLMCFFASALNAHDVHLHYDVEGYYWRDYTGTIPSDALRGGNEYDGSPIYIAQALLPLTCSIVPGQIRSTTKIMTLEMQKKEVVGTQDIKILCTKHPEQFQWILSENKFNSSTVLKGHQQFVTAGLYEGKGVIVARAHHGIELLVGKVVLREGEFHGAHVGKDGVGIEVPHFEVLVYDPTLSKISKDLSKDLSNDLSGSKTITINFNM